VKIRVGFVSNSSSSSYTLPAVATLLEQTLRNAAERGLFTGAIHHYHEWQDTMGGDFRDDPFFDIPHKARECTLRRREILPDLEVEFTDEQLKERLISHIVAFSKRTSVSGRLGGLQRSLNQISSKLNVVKSKLGVPEGDDEWDGCDTFESTFYFDRRNNLEALFNDLSPFRKKFSYAASSDGRKGRSYPTLACSIMRP